jgi:predicted metal-dependent HD superfamily phosphohydrolase
MSELTAPQAAIYCSRAQAFYTQRGEQGALPYHHWGHALDVCKNAKELAGKAIEGTVDASLLEVAAAWHDAAYHEPLAGYSSKEERSAALVEQYLVELTSAQLQRVQRAIIDTTVSLYPKSGPEGIALHFADIGYLASLEYSSFYERLAAMRAEWGGPSWQETVKRTETFAQQVMAEAAIDLVQVLPASEAHAWIERVKRNVQNLAAGKGR